MIVKFLKAFNGDCIFITFKDADGNRKNILIDGGPSKTYTSKSKRHRQVDGSLKILIDDLRDGGQGIDLLILTHVDDDHIGGLLKWFREDNLAEDLIDKVWFNSGRLIFQHFKSSNNNSNDIKLVRLQKNNLNTSIKQGNTFERIIDEANIWDKTLIRVGQVIDFYDLKFRILSPSEDKLKKLLGVWKKETPDLDTSKTNDYKHGLYELLLRDEFKEDKSKSNGSSIAFILTYKEKNMLYLADAHPSVIINSLKIFGFSKDNPIEAEFVKVSHHGSKNNTNDELLSLIDSNQYIISSNGATHNLPDKKCLARIIKQNPNAILFFNYGKLIDKIFDYNDRIIFPSWQAMEIKPFRL